jgi:hypothetical protein
MEIKTTYVSKLGYQPICTGIDESGNLVWDAKQKENWHLEMFPVPYRGDFKEQWTDFKTLSVDGFTTKDQEAIGNDFPFEEAA